MMLNDQKKQIQNRNPVTKLHRKLKIFQRNSKKQSKKQTTNTISKYKTTLSTYTENRMTKFKKYNNKYNYSQVQIYTLHPDISRHTASCTRHSISPTSYEPRACDSMCITAYVIILHTLCIFEQ